MVAYLLDEDFEVIDLVDNFISLIWTERFDLCGDFELYVPADSEVLLRIALGQYMRISESDVLMVIEKIEVVEDAENGDAVTVSGRSLESILDRRVVWGLETYEDQPVQTIIQTVLENSFGSNASVERRLDSFVFERNNLIPDDQNVVSKQYFGDNVLQLISDICGECHLGFEFKYRVVDGEIKLIFKLLTGTDRSFGQTENEFVIFAPSFNNVLDSTYTGDSTDEKNVAFIAGEGDGADRVTTSVGDAVGIYRKEIFTDAKSISSKENNRKIPEEQYIQLLQAEGDKALSKSIYDETFDGELDTEGLFTYKKDYELGDIVQVENTYGFNGQFRISEMIFSQDENGIKFYPTFRNIEEEVE